MGTTSVLDVGCASTSIITDNENVNIVDCEEHDNFHNFINNLKIIDCIFITHQHYDHFRGLKYICKNKIHVNHLIYSPYDRRYGDNSVQLDEWNEFNKLAETLRSRGTKLYTPHRQTDFSKPYYERGNVKIYIIGPTKNSTKSDTRELHDASLVITGKFNNRKCLFTGDASNSLLNELSSITNNYCDDIYIASHHGSDNGAEENFIKNAKIDETIISTQEGVYNNLPGKEALKLYNKYSKSNIHRTDKHGSKFIRF